MQDPRATRAASVDTGSLYERTRLGFVGVVAGLSEGELSVRVSATPAWSVRDVLAHVVGLTADLNVQRFPAPDDVGGTAWTELQVERGRGRTRSEVLAEWDRTALMFEEGLRSFGYEIGSHFVADLHAHYHDVRGAIGLRADADELTVRVALDHYLGFIDEMLVDAGWGTLDIVAGGEARRLGRDGQHHAAVQAEPFELWRGASGRRSAHQIRALQWSGDVDEFLGLLRSGLRDGYSMPMTDLID